MIIKSKKSCSIFVKISQPANSKTAVFLKINRNTINRHFNLFRQKIAAENEVDDGLSFGEFELDESYFGAKSMRGKRGRGAAGKTHIFGLLKREGKVYVEVVKIVQKHN